MDGQPTVQAKAGRGGGQAYPKATYQDVLDAAPHRVAEIAGGRFYAHPRPASTHALAGSSLGDELVSPYQKGRGGGPGGWWIVDEPELHFGPSPDEADVLVPDLAGWRRERMPDFPDVPYFTLAPDWVCEILSPSTRSFDLGEKRDIYAREGIPHLWLIDPEARTLEVFAQGVAGWNLLATLHDDATVSQPPFDAIAFPLSALWP